jgi:hypothetical protein
MSSNVCDNPRGKVSLMQLTELDGDNWLDHDDPLSDEEKALLETRLRDMEVSLKRQFRGNKLNAVLKNDS